MKSKIKGLLNSNIAKNGFWLIILQGFNTVVPLLTIPYVTRILSASAYGEFSLALNLIGYFQVVVEYGFGLLGARKIATRQSDDELGIIRSRILGARFILFLISLVILSVVVIVGKYDRSQMICMGLLSGLVLATVFQQTYFFQGVADMKPVSVINIISRTISVILIFILVKNTEDLYLYCLLYISTSIISCIASFVIIKRRYAAKLRRVSLKSLFAEIKEGWDLFVSSAMAKIFASAGITILGFWATKSEVGIYSAIHKIPYILVLLFSAVSQALYPHICKAFSVSNQQGMGLVKKYSKPVILLFVLMGAFIAILNKPIVRIAFGVEYEAYSLLLVPFTFWVVFGIINNFLGIQTLVASGNQSAYGRCMAISILLMIILMLGFSRIWRVYGVAIATLLSEMILTVLLAYNVKKHVINENA